MVDFKKMREDHKKKVSGELIKDRVHEALLARDFSEAESDQMIKRLIKYGEEATVEKDPPAYMYFGKYRDQSIDSISLHYLRWLMVQDWFAEEHENLAEKVEEYLSDIAAGFV